MAPKSDRLAPSGTAQNGKATLQALAPPKPLDVTQTAPPVRLSPPRQPVGERAYVLVVEEQSALPFELPPSGNVIIGRAPDATLLLADRSASRHHAQITVSDGEALVCDLGSRNGTRVNGEPVDAARPLYHGDIISICSAMYGLIEKLAATDLPILIQGETGVGKELAACAIHHFSKRQGKPFVSVNCAALPENLVESELFGHDRGAFTGAVAAKAGYFETATTGTLFLDEIGELPANTQAKILRAVDTQRITRVGEVRERTIDVRIVAATNRNLKQESEEGRFRKDLYFRLSGARVTLPPLRDRRRELPVLARSLLANACTRLGRAALEISPATMPHIQAYSWPGNVRELKNVMDYVAATVEGMEVLPWHIEEQVPVEREVASAAPTIVSTASFRPIEEELRALERQRMVEALARSGGVHTRAAELIAMPIRTFTAKVKQYQISARKGSS